MNSDEDVLGHVLSSKGSEARIGLIQDDFQAQERATIGKFVGIQTRDAVLIGMISEVTSMAMMDERPSDYRAMARVDLVGQIVSETGRMAQFRRGVRAYPAIGDSVRIISQEELRLIYSPSGKSVIDVGELHQDRTIRATVDADAMLTKHFAVLGSTGVGKSSGLAVLLGELIRVRPDVRVLLLDVHNEYGRSFARDARIIGSHNLKLPFWVLNFEEFTDVVYAGKPAVPEELEILAELIPAAKGMYQAIKSGNERSVLSRRSARSAGFTADTPAPYMMQDLLTLIDERMGKLENRATRMVHHRLTQRIEAIRNDPRYTFMFENANVGGDTLVAVLNQLFNLDSVDRGVTILKLASLPSEVIDAVVCVTTRLAFEFGIWSDGGIPILVVCEEAHRFASGDHAVGFAPARRALARIAKEGRKYGVYLGLVTQRPAELDPTIISQCSTLFFMRMANYEDQSILRSAVSDAAQNLLSFVPSLGTSEVVGIGEGMPLPARFSFRRLPREMLPVSDPGSEHSRDTRQMSRPELVRHAVDRWRSATTSTSRLPADDAPEQRPATDTGGASAIERGLRSLAGDRESPILRDPASLRLSNR
ncbi:MAG: ATP-binding protein [Mesorhizobium sp.]